MTLGVWFGVTRGWISSGKYAAKPPNPDEKGMGEGQKNVEAQDVDSGDLTQKSLLSVIYITVITIRDCLGWQ